jgi:DNA-binding CsgD family transcriptional regulator
MNGEIHYIRDGKMFSWDELTLDIATILRLQLDNDIKALVGLAAMGITDPKDQLHQFAFCNFGEFDKNADIADNGGIIHREYWDCRHRDTCRGHGWICKLPDVKKGKLTIHEIKLMQEIGTDKTNKEIASDLHISTHTVNRECTNLAHKIGCFTKTGISTFAASHGII